MVISWHQLAQTKPYDYGSVLNLTKRKRNLLPKKLHTEMDVFVLTSDDKRLNIGSSSKLINIFEPWQNVSRNTCCCNCGRRNE